MSLLPIPPLETATDRIASPADLQQRWRALMQELGFGERLLRVTFVGPDRRLVKVLIDVEIRLRPETAFADGLMCMLKETLESRDDHTVALLLTRPGRGGLSDNDRRWCRALTAAAARHDVPIEPMFRANDDELVRLDPTASAA